ncbi:iron-sulfur cluster repair di-iron protein [Paraliobacillus zengyii]|uniref:iron-sulfur cluster repair di-iron protein n=1 Tax=Paraliobacillus zengyii TaxID=2213194 RepID=UPI000DD2E92D|nr:iron-sulfur cluster repair di-iron protein [Paraliobacillus zengyii]
MQAFQINDTPAEIVKTFPQASDIFKKEQINFCCEGDTPLKEVLVDKEVDVENLLQSINQAYNSWKEAGNVVTDWNQVSSTALVEHILEHHHDYLHKELEPLSQFVTKIYRVHGKSHTHLKELHILYHTFMSDIESHLFEEETTLFPLILQYEETKDSETAILIQELSDKMQNEHQLIGDLLKEMYAVTNGFVLPEGSCNSYRMTYARLAELEANTFEHIHLENNILFKR